MSLLNGMRGLLPHWQHNHLKIMMAQIFVSSATSAGPDDAESTSVQIYANTATAAAKRSETAFTRGRPLSCGVARLLLQGLNKHPPHPRTVYAATLKPSPSAASPAAAPMIANPQDGLCRPFWLQVSA